MLAQSEGFSLINTPTVPLGPLNEEFIIPTSSLMPNTSEDIDLESFFTMAIAQKISDIHLRVGLPPAFRKAGHIVHTKFPAISPKGMQRFARWLIPDHLKPLVSKHHDLDFSVAFSHARFRVNMLYEMGNLAFVIRVIPTVIPQLDTLGHPPGVFSLSTFDNGLVLITGATGSGKSTTLAAILDHINRHQFKHIITLEDPVEFVHTSRQSMITQRQLSIDTPSFPKGIKYALRQDPDVLLIGEMRDRETAMSAIKAAETGALVYTTLHTSDAIQTINRIIDFFEPHEREAIRLQLANVLRGIMCQKLFRRPEGKGRACASELLIMTSTIRDYLLKNQLDEIYSLMDDGRFEGMQSLNYALFSLISSGDIDIEQALRLSNNPTALKQRLKGVFHGTNDFE